MAVNPARHPHLLRELDGRAAEFSKAFCVVGKVASLDAVKLVAIEIGRIVHEEITHGAASRALSNRRVAEFVTDRNRKAGNDGRERLVVAIPRQKYADGVPRFDQGLRKSGNDVCEAARLRIWQAF